METLLGSRRHERRASKSGLNPAARIQTRFSSRFVGIKDSLALGAAETVILQEGLGSRAALLLVTWGTSSFRASDFQ